MANAKKCDRLKSRSGIDLAISRALVTKKDFNAKKYTERYFER